MGRHKQERRWGIERRSAVLRVVQERALNHMESSNWDILRWANVSWSECNLLLQELIALGMLTKQQFGTMERADTGKTYQRFHYSLTEKGYQTLHLFEQLEEQFRTQDKPIKLMPY